MDEREFVARRQATWDRLGAILTKATGPGGLKRLSLQEIRDLGPLYRRASSDLAYARAHAVSEGLRSYLNDLVARSYGLLYQTDSRSWGGFRTFFARDLPQTFRRRLSFFLAAVGFLLLGYALAYGLALRSIENVDIFVPANSQMRSSLDAWKTGEVSKKIEDPTAAVTASLLMQNNIRVSFLEFAVGTLGGVFTAYLLGVNGAIVGAFAGAVAHSHQTAAFWSGILPHGVVELSETCIAGAAGLSLGWAILAPGMYRRRDALVLAARDSVKLVIGGIAMLIFAGLVEAFISHSLLPRPMKIGFGIASGIALYGYLLLAGREQLPAPATAKRP